MSFLVRAESGWGKTHWYLSSKNEVECPFISFLLGNVLSKNLSSFKLNEAQNKVDKRD